MPKVLQLPSLVPGTLVSVDGLPIPASAKTVAVFPGSHQVAVGASRLLEGDTATVMASTGIVPVTFKAKLTQEAQRQAAAVVGTAFAACAKATTLAPPNCPQSVIDNINGAATWQLFGDPAVGTSLAVGDGATVLVDGHYQMAVSYEGQYPDVQRHRAIAGAYEAELAWDGTALGLRSLGQPKTAVTEMPRPAADDATVLAAVRGAFDRCATVTTLDPADCPQYIKAYGEVAAVSWRLDRDPVTGATVSFNGSQGMFRVVGTYSMTAKYDETYQYQPTFHRSMQSTGRYTADLVWDGQKLVFVTFE